MIVYLHGLNSTGSSHKAAILRECLKPTQVISPTYPAHLASQAVGVLQQELQPLCDRAHSNHQPLILVGSSMGGFYGLYLTNHLAIDHLVLINPALKPWMLLREVLGQQFNAALNEHYLLTAEMINATRDYYVEPDKADCPLTLLLDEDDELIDSNESAIDYSGHAQVHLYPGGNHMFSHMPEACEIISQLHQAYSDESPLTGC